MEQKGGERRRRRQAYAALLLQKLTSDFTGCGLGVEEEVEAVGNEG